MSHVLLLPFGTSGSIFPFIWLGRRLMETGHRVTMAAAPDYRESALRAGLDFTPVESEGLAHMLGSRRFLKTGQGTKLAFQHAGQAAAPTAEAVARLVAAGRGPDLMLAPMVAFGARVAREKFGIPLVTVHLYPIAMMSAHEVPLVLPIIHLLRLFPLPVRKWILSVWPSPFDAHALPGVRDACLKLGVQPPRRIWREWDQSPDGVLALFPEWFASPQPDWPADVLQWDFPLEDMGEEMPMSQELLGFLDGGPPPVVFTPGTGNLQAGPFFETALAAVKQMGCRAVFATMHLRQLPHDLPDTVMAVEYAPFRELLPRARALVHPGGIGTMSQSFMAGLPQVVIPLVNDQHDNGERLERLGAGTVLRGRLSVDKLRRHVQRCLTDESMRQAAARCAETLRRQPRTASLAAWLESRMQPPGTAKTL